MSTSDVTPVGQQLEKELLVQNAFELEPIFEHLLEGGSIERVLDENVVLSEIRNALWLDI